MNWLVQTTGIELAFLDPKVACELGLVLAYLFKKPFGVLAADKHVNRVPEWVIGAGPHVPYHVHEHRHRDDSAASFVAEYKGRVQTVGRLSRGGGQGNEEHALLAILIVERTGRLRQDWGLAAESPAETRSYGDRGGVWPSMRW